MFWGLFLLYCVTKLPKLPSNLLLYRLIKKDLAGLRSSSPDTILQRIKELDEATGSLLNLIFGADLKGKHLKRIGIAIDNSGLELLRPNIGICKGFSYFNFFGNW